MTTMRGPQVVSLGYMTQYCADIEFRSGGQIESVKDQLLFAALKQVLERQEPSPD